MRILTVLILSISLAQIVYGQGGLNDHQNHDDDMCSADSSSPAAAMGANEFPDVDVIVETLMTDSHGLQLKVMSKPQNIERHYQQMAIEKIKINYGLIGENTNIYKILNQLYQEVFLAANIDPKGYKFILVDTDEINASFDPQNKIVSFNYGLLKFLKSKNRLNKGALKFILGHEIGHVHSKLSRHAEHNHSQDENVSSPLAEEYFADRFGLHLLDKVTDGHSSAESPLEALHVLESFESFVAEGGKEASYITTTHPHSHRRKMKAYYEINRQYWNNLFQESSEVIDERNLQVLRSPRYHFERKLFSSFNIENQLKMIPEINNYRELYQFISVTLVTNALQKNLNSCKEMTDSMVSSDKLDEIMMKRMLPWNLLNKDLKGDQEKIKQVRDILLQEKVIDEHGVILRALDNKKERDTIYERLLPIYNDYGYAVTELLKNHINKFNTQGDSLGIKFLKDNNIPASTLGNYCQVQDLQMAIDQRIEYLENKHQIQFSAADKQEFVFKAIIQFLENNKQSREINVKIKNELIERTKKISTKYGRELSTLESLSLIDSITTNTRTDHLSFQGFYPFLRDNNGFASYLPDILQTLKEEAGGSLPWTQQFLNFHALLAVDREVILWNIFDQMPASEDIPKLLIDHLLSNGGSLNNLSCSMLDKSIEVFPKAQDFFAFYQSVLDLIREKKDDCLLGNNFFEKIFQKYRMNLEEFSSFIQLNMKNKLSKDIMVKKLKSFMEKGIAENILTPQEAIKIYDQLVSDYRLEKSNPDLTETIFVILSAENNQAKRLDLFDNCPSCSSYQSEDLFKILCGKNNLMTCAEHGVWIPLLTIISYGTSQKAKDDLFALLQSKKGKYAKRLSKREFHDFYGELNWLVHYKDNVPIQLNKELIEHLRPTALNRYYYYKMVRKWNIINFGKYTSQFPSSLIGLDNGQAAIVPPLSPGEARRQCETMTQYVQSFYDQDSDDSHVDRLRSTLVMSEFNRIDHSPNYWSNLNELSLGPMVRALNFCLRGQGYKLHEPHIDLERKLALITSIFKNPSHQRNSLILEALRHNPLTDDPLVFDREVDLGVQGKGTQRIFDLLQSGPLKEVLGKRIILEKERPGQLNLKTYDDVRKLLDLYTEPSSPLRKEFFSYFLQNIEMTIDEMEQYQAKEQSDFEEEVRGSHIKEIFHDIVERTSDLLEDQDPSDKIKIFKWFVGKGDKPEVITKFENSTKMNLDEWPDYLSLSSEGEKFGLLSTLLLGPKGIFSHERTKEAFIADLYHYVMGKEAAADDFLFTLLKNIIDKSPQTKQMTLVYSLFGELLKTRTQQDLPEAELQEKRNKAIKKFLVSFGTVGVKLGQILSKQQALIQDPALRKVLEDLSDQVPPIDKRFILAALKRDKIDTKMIKKIGRLLGSASLKQVYQITMVDGSQYTLKFNRPMSYYEIPENLSILEQVLKSGEIQKELPVSQELFLAVQEAVKGELDLEREIRQQKIISEFVSKKGTKKIKSWTLEIPDLHPTLRGHHLYSDQLASGKPMKQELIESLPAEDLNSVSTLVLTSILEQIFTLKLYNADLHGGNILVDTAKKEVTLLDFGNCAQISKENSSLFAKLVFSLSRGNVKKVSSHLLSMLSKDADQQVFLSDEVQKGIKNILQNQQGDHAKLSQKIRMMKNLLAHHSLSLNKELEILLKVFDTIDYITKNLTAGEIQEIFIKAIGRFSAGMMYLFSS